MTRYFLIILSFFALCGFKNFLQWNQVDVEPAYAALAKACVHHKPTRQNKAFCMQFWQKKLVSPQEKRAFFEKRYQPQLLTSDGLLTAYYLPLLEGSLEKTADYPHPVWGVPKRIKKPYFTRQEIDQGALKGKENPLLWVKDKVDLFFLHIQGSGRVVLPDGKIMGLGFADKNGQKYQSIGKYMIKNEMVTGEAMSMQGIKKWLRNNPENANKVLWHNPSYVFFSLQEAPAAIGGQGVPLTPRGSIAVDPKEIPYGTPVLIETTLPDETKPSYLLTIAQDTGSAIKTKRRADWFLGAGDGIGELAGRLKQKARFTVLKPKGSLHE